MPIADTDLLFALNPKDKKHENALKVISSVRGIKVPESEIHDAINTVLSSRWLKGVDSNI